MYGRPEPGINAENRNLLCPRDFAVFSRAGACEYRSRLRARIAFVATSRYGRFYERIVSQQPTAQAGTHLRGQDPSLPDVPQIICEQMAGRTGVPSLQIPSQLAGSHDRNFPHPMTRPRGGGSWWPPPSLNSDQPGCSASVAVDNHLYKSRESLLIISPKADQISIKFLLTIRGNTGNFR